MKYNLIIATLFFLFPYTHRRKASAQSTNNQQPTINKPMPSSSAFPTTNMKAYLIYNTPTKMPRHLLNFCARQQEGRSMKAN